MNAVSNEIVSVIPSLNDKAQIETRSKKNETERNQNPNH